MCEWDYIEHAHIHAHSLGKRIIRAVENLNLWMEKEKC